MTTPQKHRSLLADHPAVSLVLPLFIQRLPETAQNLQQHLASQDAAALRALLHQLRGSGQSYGFPDITTLAQSAEEALLASQPLATVAPNVQQLITYLQNVEP